MDQDATLYGCLGLGDIVSDGDQFPHGNEHSSPLPLWLMSIVAKRSPISATAESLLSYANRQTDIQKLFLRSK